MSQEQVPQKLQELQNRIEHDTKEMTVEKQMQLGHVSEVAPLNAQHLEEYTSFLRDAFRSGQLDPIRPSSMIKSDVYENLSETQKGLVDQSTITLSGHLRMLKNLIEAEGTQEKTAQAESYVNMIFQYKTQLEQEVGDVLTL